MPEIELLAMCLATAVPLRIDELRQMAPTERDRVCALWAAEAGDALACNGDRLIRPTRGAHDEPGTAATFNTVARGLAAAAFVPGGVEFAGQRWTA